MTKAELLAENKKLRRMIKASSQLKEGVISELQEENTAAIDELNMKTAVLMDELDKALSLSEKAVGEKEAAEEKLARLQENWEKYVAGS